MEQEQEYLDLIQMYTERDMNLIDSEPAFDIQSYLHKQVYKLHGRNLNRNFVINQNRFNDLNDFLNNQDFNYGNISRKIQSFYNQLMIEELTFVGY